MCNTLDRLTFHQAPGSVLFKALAAEKQWGRSHLGCRRYLHSSFHPEWRGSPRYTRSGSCRPCWCSGRCCRSGHSADTRQCLGLKWERIKVIWRTWNYFLSPSISKFRILILYFNYLIIPIIIISYQITRNVGSSVLKGNETERNLYMITSTPTFFKTTQTSTVQINRVFSIFSR